MGEKSGIFDMLGPVMVGPSSSHTAGVVRIGRVARRILGRTPSYAHITFYNSFARTFEGHGSDRAIIGGLLDFKTDDERLKTALDLAPDFGLQYDFKSVTNSSTMHPNTVKVEIEDGDKKATIIGESTGGGAINISHIDDFKAGFNARLHTLIIKADDKKGIIAFIANILAQDECNIATMSVSRKSKNAQACHVIEMDSGIKKTTLDYLNSLEWTKEIIYIPDIDL
ncbi:MAG: L-serine ammonia-lyase, iron-sulfur-dependent subunit beta [Cyclobacteriaceae bacterium]|nr:L-serine ammonia-lyase, iron-sulfur-dependent subunit beta [Cyclobacteriaceae bacterium]